MSIPISPVFCTLCSSPAKPFLSHPFFGGNLAKTDPFSLPETQRYSIDISCPLVNQPGFEVKEIQADRRRPAIYSKKSAVHSSILSEQAAQ